jgi:hypothetical protein
MMGSIGNDANYNMIRISEEFDKMIESNINDNTKYRARIKPIKFQMVDVEDKID